MGVHGIDWHLELEDRHVVWYHLWLKYNDGKTIDENVYKNMEIAGLLATSEVAVA